MNVDHPALIIVVAARVTNVDITGRRPNPAAVPVCIVIVWPAPPQAKANADAGTKEGKASAKAVMDKPTADKAAIHKASTSKATADKASIDKTTADKTTVRKSGASSEATDAARTKGAHSSAETAHSSVETSHSSS